MKILHTADWHVGKTLHRRQRLDEAAAVLDEVVEIARDRAVDLTLVCGDIFDQFAPSAEAERIVYKALVDLRATGCAVLAIPGNHDNARRFAAIERLSEAAGIQFVPAVRRPDAGGIVEVDSRDGGHVAQVAALPWVPEKLLFGAEQMMGLEGDPNSLYAEELARLLDAMCQGFQPGKVHLLAGHLFVGGAKVGGGERTFTIGDLFAVAPQGLPTTPQYIALGHVHRPQRVTAAGAPAYYAGSLLQLDFGEREQQKSVAIVDVDPGRPAQVSEVALTRGSPLLDVTGTVEELRDLATTIDEHAWVRVVLRCDGPAPGLAELVREIIPRALDVRLEYEREPAFREPGDTQRLEPRDLFAQYYRHRYGSEIGEPLMQLFDELFEEVTGASA
jgi:DNA repair protein SbcD/Mre11